MRLPRIAFALLAAVLAAPLPASAPSGTQFSAPDLSVARGINSGSAYGTFDVDTINLFNGNLVVRIPIGDALPVGPALNQSFVLTHNSKLYDYVFAQDANERGEMMLKRRAIPERYSNAGWGWLLTLGTLVPPEASTPTTPGHGWLYRDPTGAEHAFNTASVDPMEATTTDGSHLRLRRIDNDAVVVAREVDLPDGNTQRFDAQSRLVEMRDRLGHWIRIAYEPLKWTITNGYGTKTFRTTLVNFETRTAPAGYSYEPNFATVISSIVLPAFGSASKTATYRFTYEDKVVGRGGCGDEISWQPWDLAAPLLTEIRLDDGSLKYSMTYDTIAQAECGAGLIRTMKLPAGGSIEWTHQGYELPQAECDEEHFWVVQSPGVHERILRDAQGNVIGKQEYDTWVNTQWGTPVACGAFDGRPVNAGPAPTEVRTTVLPYEMRNGELVRVGGKVIHYFSATMNEARANATGTKTAEYGLPFTRHVPAEANTARFLSTQQYDEGNGLVRSTYLTYAADAEYAGIGLSGARVQGELTVFTGDSGCGTDPCRIDVDRPAADYAGFGLYRRTVTTSNFGPTRTTFTDYQPNPADWLLNVYRSSWVEENGATSKQLATFDANGFLTTRRTLVGDTPGAGDLLEAFCRDGRGFLAAHKLFGGDGPDASIPADPCSATPAATEYQLDHTLEFDENAAPKRHTAKYRGMPFFVSDVTLDRNTGRVSESRDVSGIPTSYNYDLLGRVTEVKPTGMPWTHYEYTPPAGTAPASLRITTRPADTAVTATPLTDTRIYYDWYGRVIQEKRKIPSDSGPRWTTTNAKFNFLGRQISVSVPEFRDTPEFENFEPAKSTRTTFDVFGRPVSIIGADEKASVVSYVGGGVREIQRTAMEVALVSGTGSVTTTERYDNQGRLVQVIEPNSVLTRYSYDEGGRLTSVCQNATGAQCGQTRTFAYDNRGLLTSETHPERGKVSYAYDAAGQVLSKTLANIAKSAANHKYTYDAAGRLTKVETQDPSQENGPYRIGKVFEFGTANAGADMRLGKPVSATRYNHDAGELVVTESYQYLDRAGRLSATFTKIAQNGVTLQVLEQAQTYDSGGNVGMIWYPSCVFTGCGSAAWTHSTRTYTHGLLTSVDQFADAITYTPAGGVSKVDHAGPVTDTYTPDVTGARVQSIAFSGYSGCSGPVADNMTPRDASITPGSTATLTFFVTGATGYQWFEENGTKIVGATSASFTTPALSSNRTYYAEAFNDCMTVQSRRVTVKVCPALALDQTTPADVTINMDETATLTVVAPGATEYMWYRGDGTLLPDATGPTLTTPPLASNATYYAEVWNGCWSATTREVTVRVNPLPVPVNFGAQLMPDGTVALSWTGSSTVHHYVVERAANGSAFIPILELSGTTAVDVNVAPNTTYLYQVRAASVRGTTSEPSNRDLATYISGAPIVPGDSVITAAYFEELLYMVNLVRAVKAAPALTWTSILPPGMPAPGRDVPVRVDYILSLRSAMDGARALAGVPALTYGPPPSSGGPILARFVTEIRGGVE